MTLERTLTELETLVEYGCGYLLSRNIKNIHPLDILPQMHQSDILTYTIGNFSYDEILDEMYQSDVHDEICKWIRSNMYLREIGYDSYDVKNYVTENWNIDEIFDEDDICDYVRNDLGLDYFLDDVSLDEFMESKDMTTDDVLDELDEDINSQAQILVENMSIGEFLDVKGSYKELYDFVTDNFALADWVQWKDECTSVNG